MYTESGGSLLSGSHCPEIIFPDVTIHWDIVTVDGEVITKTSQEELSKEAILLFRNLIGDGKAKVSVASNFSIKHYGEGTSVSAAVTLTCNQDEETIKRAIDMARVYSAMFAEQAMRSSKEVYDKVCKELSDES